MSLTILSVQHSIESIGNKYKYSILYKLGVSKEQVRLLVFKQLFISFNLPFISSILGFLLFLYNFYRAFSTQFNIIFKENGFLTTGLVLPLSMFAILYLSYFVFTYFIYLRNIKQY